MSPEVRRHRWVWRGVWFSLLGLAATDYRFNPYVHSLHNDGLALFVSTLAYWLIARSGRTPGWVLLIPMALLPTVGYLVKQSLLIWLVFFSSYLLVATRTAWRQWLVFVLGSTASIVVAIGLCYWLWGDPFIWWTFIALGSKEVSVLRSAIHLFSAGGYALIGLLGGFVLLSRRVPDESWVLWGCWLLLFLIEGYTSGVAWVTNHLGPAILLATCWGLAGLAKIWATSDLQFRRPAWLQRWLS